MAITNLTDDLKEAMLGRLDPTRTIVDTGLIKVILLKRNAAGTDDEEYTASGIYGGFEDITWLSNGDTGYEEGTLKQDTSLVFNVEDGTYIEGYRIYYTDDGDTTSAVGIYQDTSTYIFDEDGTFTISNIEITLG